MYQAYRVVPRLFLPLEFPLVNFLLETTICKDFGPLTQGKNII